MSTSPLDEVLSLKRQGRLDEAVIALEGALSRTPSHFPTLIQLADVQIRRDRLDEASAALDRAEAAAGTTAVTARIRGDLHYKSRRWAEAARSYADADALGDAGTWSLERLAQCRLRVGDLDGARGAASRAVERDPSASAAWVALGDIAAREKQLDEAEAMYRRAHEAEPTNQWAYAKLVEAQVLKLPPEQRAREVQVLLKTTGKDNKYLTGVLAKLRSQLGDNEAAAKVWSKQATTGDLYARTQEGFALRKAGKLDEAAAVLGPCLIAEPENLYVFNSYVSLQKRRGAIDELRATLDKALPGAGRRKGAYFAALRKLPPPPPAPEVPDRP